MNTIILTTVYLSTIAMAQPVRRGVTELVTKAVDMVFTEDNLNGAGSSFASMNDVSFKVCNGFTEDAAISIGYKDQDGNRWTKGWLKVKSQRCVETATESPPKGNLYAVAINAKGQVLTDDSMGGTMMWCVPLEWNAGGQIKLDDGSYSTDMDGQDGLFGTGFLDTSYNTCTQAKGQQVDMVSQPFVKYGQHWITGPGYQAPSPSPIPKPSPVQIPRIVGGDNPTIGVFNGDVDEVQCVATQQGQWIVSLILDFVRDGTLQAELLCIVDATAESCHRFATVQDCRLAAIESDIGQYQFYSRWGGNDDITKVWQTEYKALTCTYVAEATSEYHNKFILAELHYTWDTELDVSVFTPGCVGNEKCASWDTRESCIATLPRVTGETSFIPCNEQDIGNENSWCSKVDYSDGW